MIDLLAGGDCLALLRRMRYLPTLRLLAAFFGISSRIDISLAMCDAIRGSYIAVSFS